MQSKQQYCIKTQYIRHVSHGVQEAGKTMRVQALKCFGEAPGDGNPALVIEGDASNDAARHAFAKARNTTCVYLEGDVVDFHYPHTRSPLCLHATLAVARVLFARRPDDVLLTVTTAVHGQRLDLVRDGAALFVRLQAQEAAQPELPPGSIARLLAMPGLALPSAPRVASVGSPKLLVEVPDVATLHALAPDLHAIAAWGKEAGVNGIYAWCRLPGEQAYEGRNFNHLDPLLEDSATGVAAGALTALLGHGLRLRQGRASGSACLIETRIEGNTILVGGRAEPDVVVASTGVRRGDAPAKAP